MRAAAAFLLVACQGSEPTAGGATAAPLASKPAVTALPAATPAAVARTSAASPTPVAGQAQPSPVPVARESSLPGLGSPVAAGPGCRVVTITGAATRDGQALHVGDAFGGAPVELAADARLHFVHVSTARAWSLHGPAHVLACEGAAEEIVLADGTLRAEPGSGVRPGAEVWVGTPFGAIRYADASATLDATERQLSVKVATGSLWFTPLGGDSRDERLIARSATFSAAHHRLAGRRAIERCSQDAAAAEERARALLAPSTRPLGERAAEHVRARQRARASCLAARAVALAAPLDASGGAELARSDALWRGVPARSSAARQP
jgi:hypothetical protein